ncbi:hypothetical protein D3W54_04915 [Komagataeibacter medellinensis]|uniref:Antitoxin VbhA domain-containing protein n=1 Tax=Komagataeibacter medellinensis TaxID=1177712 RepID=A0ABQ6VTY5_9PROT|nr:antitoxin VbhA family protein [Komagataeibacter medellinensis]KAB8123656.1 hypothetical protein D3W54_04915 [Komagataeibacter medellinensis]
MSEVLVSRPKISAGERLRRKEAVDYARGSVRLEGVILDVEIERINARFIEGELTIAEHFQALDIYLDL